MVLKRLTIFLNQKNIGKRLNLFHLFFKSSVFISNKQKSSRLL
ncbi:hypothetical protein J500_1422 [Acinetobacter sp. 479375]|nr:hypothetical protein J500_1422 [Acinetobacter sp. 479375]